MYTDQAINFLADKELGDIDLKRHHEDIFSIGLKENEMARYTSKTASLWKNLGGSSSVNNTCTLQGYYY